MSEERIPYYKTAGLLINADTGEVSNPTEKLRLSPVNNRVLNALLKASGKAVSRQQLFDQVWPNQVISDDALTRSISDLRAQLKTLSDTGSLIETIPKVGYRWQQPLADVDSDDMQTTQSLWQQHAKPALLALIILLVISWMATTWFQHQNDKTNLLILDSSPADMPNLADCLKTATQAHPKLHYLSNHAIKSHNGNPYPFFAHEFNISWFIESNYHYINQQTHLTISLIDARTGLVVTENTAPFKNIQNTTSFCQNFIGLLPTLQ
jgi:DNA-binding winged helix-turn-helix (wHTH) protein